jgi:3-dehydroquinate synthase
MRGLLEDDQYERLLWLFSHAGLSMDHHQFDEAVLEKATTAILKTRDGLLRAAVPSPLGSCVFPNDVSQDELSAALRRHKEVVRQFPRNGEGVDAFVDASDTGEGAYEHGNNRMNGVVNGHSKGPETVTNGAKVNGYDGAHTIDYTTEKFFTLNGADVLVHTSNDNGSLTASRRELPLANGSTS